MAGNLTDLPPIEHVCGPYWTSGAPTTTGTCRKGIQICSGLVLARNTSGYWTSLTAYPTVRRPERRVIHQVKIDPKISAPKIAASTSNTLGRSVSAETVRRVLRKAGYNGRVARKKPLIGKRNRVKRLKFTKEHILKPRQFWNEVIFSDESKFNIFGSDRRRMSSDLNVIENLWSHLERAVQKHQITSKEQLKSVLQEELLNIAPETTRHLVESMPRQLEAVISAKCYATKY
ncbi:transposable element Tcb1 transposase [Trichonephila clavipes]|nr:transposable element Tcb1 transposase [Trichonephila clavipes]